ncbi:hypothetical protein QVD17_14860 [Tagetes erecta]|uniref:Protein kinase domain-containing protein n=1 Tax=Tagetes erecta TaxID=13708 RepID=A0AAD8KS34_TARER|nr:hypothetical protein QVD17_14860 [Tagetes erecta]
MSSSSSSSYTDISLDKYWDSLEISYEEVETATNNFADENLLKRGTCYDVYKGQLIDHEQGDIHDIVARVSKNDNAVIDEMEMSYHVNHTNITSPFRVYDENDHSFIVLNKHEANGSLDKHLSAPTLTWIQRLHICVGVARALKYLHNDVWDDDEYVIHDPEYMSTGKLKTKSDVYSFGVVLFEIISGKLAYDKTFVQEGLPSIARQCFNEGTLNTLIDPKIMEDDESISLFSGGANQDSLDTFTKVAFQCLAETQSERPTMEVVIKELTKALNFQGLRFLHGGNRIDIHRDIRSSSILLDGDWNAKICNFESTCERGYMNKLEHINDKDCSSLGYTNLQYQENGYVSEEFDVYALGVILTEMLCGRLAWFEGCVEHSQSLGPLFVRHYNENGDVHKMIFEAIKEQIAPQSLNTFQCITLQCLEYEHDDRPKTNDVVIQLEKALRFQEDYEIWEHKLPIDYEEIIKISKLHSEMNYSTTTKKDLYNMFSTGILLQDSKLLFSLGSNGERNELASARMFTYKNRTSHKWQSDHESR